MDTYWIYQFINFIFFQFAEAEGEFIFSADPCPDSGLVFHPYTICSVFEKVESNSFNLAGRDDYRRNARLALRFEFKKTIDVEPSPEVRL